MATAYLSFAILCGILALVVHRIFRRNREFRVCITNFYAGNFLWLIHEKKEEAIGELHGCLPAPRLRNYRPLGIDQLVQIFRADNEGRLMEHFQFTFRQTGNTLEQVLLGTKAFGTNEPANLEALLSTNFKGSDQ
jgi:hypothetical protein